MAMAAVKTGDKFLGTSSRSHTYWAQMWMCMSNVELVLILQVCNSLPSSTALFINMYNIQLYIIKKNSRWTTSTSTYCFWSSSKTHWYTDRRNWPAARSIWKRGKNWNSWQTTVSRCHCHAFSMHFRRIVESCADVCSQGDETTLAVSYQQLPTAVKPGLRLQPIVDPSLVVASTMFIKCY